MSDQSQAEHRERVVRTVEYNTGGSAPDALDADHIRVHLCANGGYPVDEINQAIADALKAAEIDEEAAPFKAAISDGSLKLPSGSFFMSRCGPPSLNWGATPLKPPIERIARVSTGRSDPTDRPRN